MSNLTLQIIETGIEGLRIVIPCQNESDGENQITTYERKLYFDNGLDAEFVQDNELFSVLGVLRGLHVQKSNHQSKLIYVISGMIFDVAVDLRQNSKTYGKWFGTYLSAENHKQLYIPEGFAHGFHVKSDTAKICYKVSSFWVPGDEIGIPWDDEVLNIDWKMDSGEEPIIAEKDRHYLPFSEQFMRIGE